MHEKVLLCFIEHEFDIQQIQTVFMCLKRVRFSSIATLLEVKYVVLWFKEIKFYVYKKIKCKNSKAMKSFYSRLQD